MSNQPLSAKNLDFLLSSSKLIVQEYELAQWNLSRNLSKQLRAIVDEIVELRVRAEIARLVQDNWGALHSTDAPVIAEEADPGISLVGERPRGKYLLKRAINDSLSGE